MRRLLCKQQLKRLKELGEEGERLALLQVLALYCRHCFKLALHSEVVTIEVDSELHATQQMQIILAQHYAIDLIKAMKGL